MSLPRRKKILVYGAGAIGRGYLPWVFSPDEFEYYYVERNDGLREMLKSARQFTTWKTVKKNSENLYETLVVPITQCFAPGEEKNIIKDIDVVVVAVGPRNVLSLTSSLKGTTMPIVCCENDSSIPVLLSSVVDNPNIVFAVPDVITSNTASEDIKKSDPLSIITEDGVCYIDDRVSRIGGNAMYISKEELDKQWMAKLYLHNTPHCIAAYLGSLLGVQYVHEAMEAPQVRKIVSGAMCEMQEVLLKKFKIDERFIDWYADKELERFSNRLLFDPVSRVAREPFRKLAPSERLLGAAQLCLSTGVHPQSIMLGIMAAFFYSNQHDPDLNIQYLVRSLEATDFLRIVMQLPPDQALHQLLLEQWESNKMVLKAIYE
jgi:mannitol-1-phosphate/altronate dehydrogenase